MLSEKRIPDSLHIKLFILTKLKRNINGTLFLIVAAKKKYTKLFVLLSFTKGGNSLKKTKKWEFIRATFFSFLFYIFTKNIACLLAE